MSWGRVLGRVLGACPEDVEGLGFHVVACTRHTGSTHLRPTPLSAAGGNEVARPATCSCARRPLGATGQGWHFQGSDTYSRGGSSLLAPIIIKGPTALCLPPASPLLGPWSSPTPRGTHGRMHSPSLCSASSGGWVAQFPWQP